MRRMGILLGSIVLLLGAVGVASADRDHYDDPRESGPFDIDRISHRHAEDRDGSHRIQHEMTTYDRWESWQLRCENYFFMVIKDTNRSVRIFWDDTLKARVLDFDRPRGEQTVGWAPVWRSGPRSVTVALRRTLLGPVGEAYKWRGGFWGGPCRCDDVEHGGAASCIAYADLAPRYGWLRHDP